MKSREEIHEERSRLIGIIADDSGNTPEARAALHALSWVIGHIEAPPCDVIAPVAVCGHCGEATRNPAAHHCTKRTPAG